MNFIRRIQPGMDTARTELISKLYDIDSVKFGTFILKSGMSSPLYIDFRGIISEPELMKQVSDLLYQKAAHLEFVSVCGVPYTALPFATLISAKYSKPMLIRRKEVKAYGTKKVVEGRIKPGDVCLVVEDVVTTGTSIWETVDALQTEGVKVNDAVVLLDRGQGGCNNLRDRGITLHNVFTMDEILDTLEKLNKIDKDTADMVRAFLEDTRQTKIIESATTESQQAVGASVSSASQQAAGATIVNIDSPSDTLPYVVRAEKCTHRLAKQLFTIMHQKKTNLAFAADVEESSKLLELADKVGPHICVLKTHADLLKDFNRGKMTELQEIARRHNFLIFEDRKFADIGETVRGQYGGGTLTIKDWSDFVTVHSVPGPGVIYGLRKVDASKGCVIVAQMSSEGCLTNNEYVQGSIALAEKHRDFVVGFVCQSRVAADPTFVYFTPGVHADSSSDSLGQQYRSPQQAIVDDKCDVIIVGRAIRDADDPAAVAENYKTLGYQAYEQLLSR